MIVRDQYTVSHACAFSGSGPRGCIALALLLLALVIALPQALVHATEQRPLILHGQASMDVLSKHLDYTIDETWQLNVGNFTGPSAVSMAPLATPIPDFGYTSAKIWLRLGIVNGTSQQDDWRFFLHTNFTQQITVYKVSADGAVTVLLDLDSDSPFSARPVDYPQMVAPFQLGPGDAATLLVSYYSQGASRLSMSLETPESFAKQARINEAKNYAFYGMMLVMIALASVALVVLRQAVFAAYGGYVIFMLTYVAHSDGVAFQYIWSDFPRFNSMASVVAGAGVMMLGGIFAMTILQTARFHPIMHRVLIGVVVSVLAVVMVLWPTDPQLLKRLLVVLISVCTLTYLISSLVAARTRFHEVRFYVFAWFAVLIPACLFTARFAFGLEPKFITLYDAIRLGLIFEALLMGLAIFDRYNQLRHSAMEESLAQAHKSLALSQRLAALEGSYEQVKEGARLQVESAKDTAHDLRQPMQALRLSLRQMLAPQEGKAKDAGQIESALAYMERLVAERLEDRSQPEEPIQVSTHNLHAETPASKAETNEPSLHDVMRGIADMFTAEAAAKGLELRLIIAAPNASVASYPLMRILANLVSNAIKYTRQGRILIGLRHSTSGHYIDIHDTGPGLSGAIFEHALVRNARLDRDLEIAAGSGLGLSVVKEIAESNGWRLSSNEKRQTGASIRVEL